MERGSPGAIGTPSGAVSEHLLELRFCDAEAIRCKPPWAK